MNTDKQKPSRYFAKGNFSCDLENVCETKKEFIEAYAGKLNVDLATLWAELSKARTAYNKSKPKKKEQKEETSKKTTQD